MIKGWKTTFPPLMSTISRSINVWLKLVQQVVTSRRMSVVAVLIVATSKVTYSK